MFIIPSHHHHNINPTTTILQIQEPKPHSLSLCTCQNKNGVHAIGMVMPFSMCSHDHPAGFTRMVIGLSLWALLGAKESSRPTISASSRTPSLAGQIWP